MSSKEYIQGKAEKDARDKTYNPPHGVHDDLTTWSDKGMQKIADDNTTYKEAYRAEKERERGRNS